jgi:signal transduction histidine kinase
MRSKDAASAKQPSSGVHLVTVAERRAPSFAANDIGPVSEVDKRRDEMIALLIHDLKSPLSALTMNIGVALEQIAPDSLAGAALKDARVSAARLFRMIANLLDVAKAEDGRLAPKLELVDVAGLVDSIVREHAAEARSRGIVLERRIDAHFGSVDPDLITRLVENLLENALRFTRKAGRILIALDVGEDALHIRVANEGATIRPELRARIFEKYGQAEPGLRMNRGLGLYFCRVAAEAHAGTIAIVDEPGYSTAFEVKIPHR